MRNRPVATRYAVKEVYYTLQGEGARSGRAAVFCRFAGCNLWDGRESSRASAICSFCDTDFVGTDGPGGGVFNSPEALADRIVAQWPDAPKRPLGERPYVVCTGGEPLLQLDEQLVDVLHERGWEVAVETNGTKPCPTSVDWICVSPKAGAELVQTSGHELKLVYPQAGAEPEVYTGLDFEHFILQPLDDAQQADHARAAAEYCLRHPGWRLGLQMHKQLGLR
jgi:7-carboxy-7-deazaguanine synthase (Cx14CxxC type)